MKDLITLLSIALFCALFGWYGYTIGYNSAIPSYNLNTKVKGIK